MIKLDKRDILNNDDILYSDNSELIMDTDYHVVFFTKHRKQILKDERIKVFLEGAIRMFSGASIDTNFSYLESEEDKIHILASTSNNHDLEIAIRMIKLFLEQEISENFNIKGIGIPYSDGILSNYILVTSDICNFRDKVKIIESYIV